MMVPNTGQWQEGQLFQIHTWLLNHVKGKKLKQWACSCWGLFFKISPCHYASAMWAKPAFIVFPSISPSVSEYWQCHTQTHTHGWAKQFLFRWNRQAHTHACTERRHTCMHRKKWSRDKKRKIIISRSAGWNPCYISLGLIWKWKYTYTCTVRCSAASSIIVRSKGIYIADWRNILHQHLTVHFH